MTRAYRAHWDKIDAVRELVQNCIDNHNCRSTFEIEPSVNGRVLVTVTTKGFTLPRKVFALGVSEKPDGAIGGFGEGFKLAMMILTRDGLEPVIRFDKQTVIGSFTPNQLELNTFHMFLNVGNPCEDTIFHFFFPEDEIDELKRRVPVFSDHPIGRPKHAVDVLTRRPREIFIQGLWVCDIEQFKHGYNFERLDLGTDRKIASSFGMSWETSRMWAKKLTSVGVAHEVLNMLEDEMLDVCHIDSHATKDGCKALAKAFHDKFGKVTIKSLYSQVGFGQSVGSTLYTCLAKSGAVEITNSWQEPNTPFKQLERMMAEHGPKRPTRLSKAVVGMLDTSKKWRK
ncbi:MAG: hypothetical protein HRU18_06865 [Pseudoalteromonas sp.]|uniref:hypothetical protein n=1 Tax=Pseudoalteromonas sp. TaxID=53249 RepID=UPI001E086D96|nr:hypothetical protein [Pseudoalteromonas sp.]NRA77912.1 hypothetical protein [Pseudoalteromonas sp.]